MRESQVLTLKSLLPPLLIWAAALYGVLQLQHAETSLATHGICGPWGCGPPVHSLLAYHGFWFVLLIPPAVWGGRRIEPSLEGLIGRVFGITLGLCLVGFLCWNTGHWVVSHGNPQFALQHALFTVATLVDVPIVPVLICCAWFCVDARVRKPAGIRTDESAGRQSPTTGAVSSD